MKRSSCASGSGYVPSYSIGFCVATTKNGRSSGYVSPSIVTCVSCIASSSADCVFGEARLISSTRRTFANTGPGRNSNSPVRWLKTLTPVTSLGRRSGVNWSRENERCSERATDFARTVFPTPGKSSMIRWPSASTQRTHSSSVVRGARTARCRFSTTRSTTSAADRETTGLSARAASVIPSRVAAPLRRGQPRPRRASAPSRRGDRRSPRRRPPRSRVESKPMSGRETSL